MIADLELKLIPKTLCDDLAGWHYLSMLLDNRHKQKQSLSLIIHATQASPFNSITTCAWADCSQLGLMQLLNQLNTMQICAQKFTAGAGLDLCRVCLRKTTAMIVLEVFTCSAGCGFVQFRKWSQAESALEAHNGKTRLAGSEVPLVVKFAYAKRKDQALQHLGLGLRDAAWTHDLKHMDTAAAEFAAYQVCPHRRQTYRSLSNSEMLLQHLSALGHIDYCGISCSWGLSNGQINGF